MVNTVKMAVVTRTKDRPIFLRRALESVAAQTYKDYVHVIVNDGGSQDEVDSLVSELSDDQRKKTSVFHRQTSSGAPDSIFNESIDRVDSEYFTIHDDDDTWEPEFLATCIEHMDGNLKLAAVVVRADKITELVSKDGRIRLIKAQEWIPEVRVISLYRQCIDNQFTPIATVFRRSAYQAVGKFDSTLPVVGDWEFGIRLLQKYDADFIDPGRAIAHYHHRRKPGGGSFDSHSHRYYFNKVSNAYLRKEMEAGVFGPGYIMSKIKYDQGYVAKLVSSVLPSGITSSLKNRVRKQ